MTGGEVLVALIEMADDRGYARTTADELALASGLSRSTVLRHLRLLEASGAIRRKGKKGGGGGLLIRLERWESNVSNGSTNVSTNVSNGSDYAKPFELGSGSAKPNQEPEPNSATNECVTPIPAFRPTMRELSDDERQRGAQFFRELRLGLNPDQSAKEPNRLLKALEPLPKGVDE